MKHEDIESHARNTLCDLIDTNEEELQRLRTDANRFLRQRNELLEKMHLINAAIQIWAAECSCVDNEAMKTLEYIGNLSGSAIADIQRNGQ